MDTDRSVINVKKEDISLSLSLSLSLYEEPGNWIRRDRRNEILSCCSLSLSLGVFYDLRSSDYVMSSLLKQSECRLETIASY
jgi:hypothetical protein